MVKEIHQQHYKATCLISVLAKVSLMVQKNKKNSLRFSFILICTFFLFGLYCTRPVAISSFSILHSNALKCKIGKRVTNHTFNLLTTPIIINSDSDFKKYNFPGNGTIDNPYIISNITIITNETIGIFISQTTAYFLIYNCFITATNYGIYLSNVHKTTALIFNNNIAYNKEAAIYISSSLGVKIKDNSLFYNGCGILTLLSSNSQIINNTIIGSKGNGIKLINSDSSLIIYNNVSLNERYGIYVAGNCQYNSIHHNWFIENSKNTISQGYDDGIDNLWFSPQTEEGNYWSNWDGVGGYLIDGNANSVDYYPLDITGTRHSTSASAEITEQVLSQKTIVVALYILIIGYITQKLKEY